ncbi:CDP-alcohol phosphatidyltransferase family protein [Streptomyces anthocyanicus]|uniref:CDP-alcohol phosphatidyltransferase family protein n=1 Tax=Streptomyces anthocyanicus TaxID=68174 RepID=UPI00336A42CB
MDSVTKRYPDGTVAVDRLSLEIPDRAITVFVGPSGCGKTTTLRMINRMVEPTEGTILLDGEDLQQQPVTTLRRSMGYVIQNAGLFQHRTILDNIATVPRMIGWGKQKSRERAAELMERVGDGHLARTYNLVTDFGKIADPIADKAIMGAALICLSALGDLPWWVTAVILGRELGITVLRFVVIRYGVIPASRGGKLKTLIQGIAVGMYVLALTGPLATLRFWVMAAAVVLTVATGLDYVKQAIVLRRRGIAERRAALKETEV